MDRFCNEVLGSSPKFEEPGSPRVYQLGSGAVVVVGVEKGRSVDHFLRFEFVQGASLAFELGRAKRYVEELERLNAANQEG